MSIWERIIKMITDSDILCHTCGENSSSYCAEAIATMLVDKGVTLLPINAGDMIYRPFGNTVESWTITTIVLYPEEIVFIDDSENSFKESDIGVSVFTTREEAEQALRTPQNDEVRE